jgi:aryl-alcohol dehydrogenase-like predicted oxidoreductase
MQTRRLGKTDLHLPILGFGASSLGQEFRSVKIDEALASVRAALECGMNFIDTSPFYGRGMSEVLPRNRPPRCAARELPTLHETRPI